MLPPLSREEHPADALSASVQLRRFPLRLDRPPMLSNRLGPVPAHLYWKERSPSQMPIRREGTMRHSQKNGAVFLHVFYRSEEHTSELQSLMRISYAVFCLKNKQTTNN